MLSRVANTLYWMVRYVERADNLARLIDVNEQLLLDFEALDSERLRGFWEPIILSTGDEEAFHKLYDHAGSQEVIRFLTDDVRNPNSIFSCIAMARENARMVRDQLSDGLWEELNSLYHYTRSAEAVDTLNQNPTRFYERVRSSSMTFLGIAAATTPRSTGWSFMDLGRHLERADKTTRFLDIFSYYPGGSENAGESSPGILHWTAILRSCGAMGAFRSMRKEITPQHVAEFLLFSRDFPRSVRYCMDRVDESLHVISGTIRGSFSNEAERKAGNLLAKLSYSSIEEVFQLNFHSYLDDMQSQLNQIADHIFETYVLMPDRIHLKPTNQQAGSSEGVAQAWEISQQQQQQQ